MRITLDIPEDTFYKEEYIKARGGHQMTKTIKLIGNEEDVNKIIQMLRHMEYLGEIGASRNLLVRVDGDGSGRIHVRNEDDTPIDKEVYNTEQIKKDTHVVGIYDIG